MSIRSRRLERQAIQKTLNELPQQNFNWKGHKVEVVLIQAALILAGVFSVVLIIIGLSVPLFNKMQTGKNTHKIENQKNKPDAMRNPPISLLEMKENLKNKEEQLSKLDNPSQKESLKINIERLKKDIFWREKDEDL